MYRFALLFLTLAPALLAGQSSWTLAKDNNGIQVYTKDKENSDFKSSKVTSVVEASLQTFAALFRDVDAYDKLFPSSKSAELLERNTDRKQVHYIISEAPWPVDDRDGVYEYLYSYNAGAKILKIEMRGLPDYLPEKDGMVRIRICDGTWTFEQLDANRCRVTYEFHADPAGTLPAWLANASVTSVPYELMTNLKERVQLDKYRTAKVSLIP
ncbi:MAG: START domain-containing protein [Phaeodactylibacter sp.]|nr:START domain-containing protein [Phaeodactylibacter sp.]